MRILVVDDEIVSRKKMEKILASFGDCVAVDSGEAALKAIETALEKGEPFDLITLDVSMPHMDGTEVLYEIRIIEKQRNISKENQSKVIMVTSQSDKDTVITCMQAGCDSYVVKPFDRAIIAKILGELGMSTPAPVQEGQSIRKMVMETIDKFNQGKISLPVLPQITREIEAAISSPTSGTEELAGIIEKDAVISVKVIATANSALYKGVDKVQDLRTAIARLGTKEIQNIVSIIANRNLYESKNKLFKGLLKKLWLHSLCCAYCCRAISVRLGDRDSGKVFLMGLTHDIGTVMLLKSIGDIAPDTLTFDKNELMESLLDVHTSFGAAILTNLGFGREFADVVKRHKWSSFEKGTPKEILIVNLAEKVSTKINYGFFESDADLTNLESAMTLGIDDKALSEMAEEVGEGMKDIEKVIN
jgi:HD-like signal output (HDOD) protein/DNA-binding NarL/FixJ family response regulator